MKTIKATNNKTIITERGLAKLRVKPMNGILLKTQTLLSLGLK